MRTRILLSFIFVPPPRCSRGVTVTVLETNTGVSKTLTTNDSGLYEAVSILPGIYRLTFAKDGFSKLVKSGIELHVGTIAVDAQLNVGTQQQVVDVSTEVPLLKTESGEQATSLQSETMAKLPNVGQDWANFTKMLPGVTGSETSLSVNGNMKYEDNFLSDGGSVYAGRFAAAAGESPRELAIL